jgi:hypothetical protein
MLGLNPWSAFALALVAMTGSFAVAQGTDADKAGKADVAPVPEQLKAAKKIFIGNAGADGMSSAAFARAGDVNQAYDVFYAAMKEWGRYKLVGSPADADLVMEVRFETPMTDCGNASSYTPTMELKVLDGKTHFQLWTVTAPVQPAFRKETWNKNVEKGAAMLVDGLKKVSGEAGTSGSAGK